MSRRQIIGLGATLLVAVIVAWATGIASTSSNANSSPFSVTESEVRAECMSGTFVPEQAGVEIAEAVPPRLPRHFPPIRFPWTVSLTKPLNLYLAVQARDIYCDWTARISWTSESSHGVIQVDNGGKKFRIVDGQGTGWSKPGPDGQWSDSGSSIWIGVK